MSEPLSHHAALIYVMVTMSAVDRTMHDKELARIGETGRNRPGLWRNPEPGRRVGDGAVADP